MNEFVGRKGRRYREGMLLVACASTHVPQHPGKTGYIVKDDIVLVTQANPDGVTLLAPTGIFFWYRDRYLLDIIIYALNDNFTVLSDDGGHDDPRE